MGGLKRNVDHYDYVVVGAGSAGCVLANRLSADPDVSVLLLEAGRGDRHPLVRMPLGWFALVRSGSFDWHLRNEPEEALGGRVWPQPRGKLLGGTSSINGTMYSRGCAEDYDEWARSGLTGWDYSSVLPYFRRSEANWRGEDAYHGSDGPLAVSRGTPEPLLHEAVVQAGRELGFGVNDDFNGPVAGGFGMPDFNVRGGRRHSSADAFLRPARRRRNLTIRTGVQVSRVVIRHGRAIGVDVADGGQTRRLIAEREVVLSAGAYHSPHLLMLSGIGDARLLRSRGIAPVVDLPSVGQGLQDHPMVGAVFTAAAPVTFENALRADRLALAAVDWIVRGRGPLSRQPLTAQAFLSLLHTGDWPDVQLQVSHVSMMARPWFPLVRRGAGHHFSVGAMQLQPEGTGEITLRSSDPDVPPRIRLGLLSTETDRRAAREMLRFVRRLFATKTGQALVSNELLPGEASASDAELDAAIRTSIMTGSHPTSTCAMGASPSSVLDGELRVRGVDGLRVADASAIPRIPRGNTNAPTMIIAEKAADLILQRTPPEPAKATQAPMRQGVRTDTA